jgi:hypothetical protein
VKRALVLLLAAACSGGHPTTSPSKDGSPQLDASAGAPGAGRAAGASGPGGVAGLVVLAAPPPREVTIPGPPLSPCGRPAPPEVRLSPYAGVVGALVWLEGPGLPPASATATELVLHDCAFTDRLVLVSAGSKLVIRNDDPRRHTVRLLPEAGGAPVAAIVLPLEGSRYEVTLPAGARLIGECDAGARALVVTPLHGGAAVTDRDGKFSIGGSPPGHYRLEAWHPAPGGGALSAELELTVRPGEMSEHDLRLAR